MKIANNITELIGKTPLLKLINYSKKNNLSNSLIAKLEYFNPAGSVKDRIAYAMILDAEEKELINKETVLIEPTSGNTGVALAAIATSRGYKLILTMPETMSIERKLLFEALGAELVLTPGEKGMSGAIRKAENLNKSIENSYIMQQFNNMANPDIHRKTTANEILADTAGNIDVFIAGVGTGGTITGVGEILKSLNSDIKIIAVEPLSSPVLSGGKPSAHKIQGIGAGFIPEVLNTEIIDEIITVENEDAFKAARLVAKSEGLIVGISSGATLHAATEIARRDNYINKNIVVLLPDTGERYLSCELYKVE
ncbi:Cysteine synthase [Candidatus Syntrophocurvum alkaliphilum]|uniref:Cysteine synthase n=1 Tax=Candidatus Syntrophocurvum alkaliphilum TaxID=2293317 RepID=A0A6I6DDN0_9FIRM|nr:cysteine synthase A [Candidatus Syntrophocurvum alkaliphilum]QGT99376.1 Cysteine synthase [Candidatus Syntrophocurvum alkaliphilum]